MRHSYRYLILPLTLMLGACGTIAEGQMQKVTLLTPGATEAECTLDNGVRYKVRTGETIEIMRTQHDLVADCFAIGNRHKQVIFERGINGWTAANVANAVVPGVAYDAASGGLYEYADTLTVDFIGVPTRGFELPDYHNKDAPNPYKQSIEEYSPSTPRIEEDSTYLKRGVEKRGAGAGSNPFATNGSMGGGTPDMMPMPTGSAPTAAPTAAAPAPILKGGSADELTRSMNPTVFNRQ